jgi:hypothetical protein
MFIQRNARHVDGAVVAYLNVDTGGCEAEIGVNPEQAGRVYFVVENLREIISVYQVRTDGTVERLHTVPKFLVDSYRPLRGKAPNSGGNGASPQPDRPHDSRPASQQEQLAL